MEHLLLDQSDVENRKNSGSLRSVKLSNTIIMEQQNMSTKCSDLNEIDHGQAKPVEEDRRARHRAVQRRYIKRRKAEVKRIKELVQTLENRYCCLEIAAEERDLKLENGELRARIDAVAASVPRVPHVDLIQLLMQNQLELVKEFYEPLTSQELVSIQQKTQVEYEMSRRDNKCQTSGASIMGWTDFRKMDESSVKFMLSKEFPNVQALHLMSVTWDTLSLPATYATFFSPAFPIKTQVLQTFGRDAVVIHRVLFNPHTQSSSNSLELLWRVRLGEEYVIFDSALQHNAVQQCLGASYKWTQMTTSLGFAPLDVNRVNCCVLRHGGWIRASVQNVDFWFKEMFFMALRFESTMVASVFPLSYED
ncbi:hypothetical protein KXD40_006714 [Peronospora effusa]|uniref:BZIP domain-containing protein n=2 Tax=Peronospora effusa TaxID=542832 RepID=A0A3M6VWR3_9STRA|nr:hypothetical protein DD238_000914 [Peronospora effusa]UIZ24610.1 hypothetical protein KXD40_006714 [Peronospora effusa]CAI5719162.1 unnamed protein product [Peronospora effusa]